jgi:P27 family predicted phage terminase small subunit
MPKCPKHLDKGAREEWKRMSKELEPLGLLTNLDKAVFANYCDAYSQWAQASRKIQESGMLVRGTHNTPVVNPLFRIANAAKDQMMRCLTEMGMTPSSRARVKANPPVPKEKNRKERFFN